MSHAMSRTNLWWIFFSINTSKFLGVEKSKERKGKMQKWTPVPDCFLGGVCRVHLWAKCWAEIPSDSPCTDIKEQAGLWLHCLSAQPWGFCVRTLCSGKIPKPTVFFCIASSYQIKSILLSELALKYTLINFVFTESFSEILLDYSLGLAYQKYCLKSALWLTI